MFEELNAHRQAVRENIEKAFEVGFTENNYLEKARQVGDIHPNGKWVWTQLPSGKFDWRVIKKTGTPSGSSAPATVQKQASEKTDDGGSNKLSQSAAKSSDKALERASKDPKASAEVKSAADSELKKRSGSSDDSNTSDKQFPELIVDGELNSEHPAVKTGLAREMTEWNIKDHYPNRITDAEKSQGFINIFQKYLKSGKINENVLEDYLMQYMGEGGAYKLLSIAEKNSGEEDGEFTKKYNAYTEECRKKLSAIEDAFGKDSKNRSFYLNDKSFTVYPEKKGGATMVTVDFNEENKIERIVLSGINSKNKNKVLTAQIKDLLSKFGQNFNENFLKYNGTSREGSQWSYENK